MNLQKMHAQPGELSTAADPLWFKDAVIYQLHVKAFFDGNNDGVGDFIGLTQKLDYLSDMGVTALWLLPFYPSPLRDDGYDIADYLRIHPSYGTMRDFRRFMDACRERGLRVITELVINHTSDQHPWFQRARHAKPGSAARNYYVWSDTDQKYQNTRIIFLDTEKSNWAWDDTAKAYYWHRFFSHQPDLNFDNPKVLAEVLRVLDFWMKAGIDGFRLDAVPYLVERDGTNNENLPETHEVLKKIRASVEEKYPDRMLLAEANQWPEDVLPYFGAGDECHMAFHFPLMPRIYMAIAQEDRHPITDIMRQTPDLPPACQWAIFLRNHDELTLEMVTDKERDYLWSIYAPGSGMRSNLGIRRRLAPLMSNDRPKIELMNALLLSLPGTPVIYYGDEIGMGDNIHLGDRNGVRTPMQWSPDRNGGFSRADPARLYLPPIMDAVYGYGSVNVEAQLASVSSLLHWTRRLLSIRKAQNVFGRGTLEFLYPGNRRVLAFLRRHEGRTVLCVYNLSRAAQAVMLDLSRMKGAIPVELMGRSAFPPVGELPYLITLPAYGFFWFVLAGENDLPQWHASVPEPVPEFVTIVTRDGWRDLLKSPGRELLERESLPPFLVRQRWFAGKNDHIASVRIARACDLPDGSKTYILAELEVTFANGSPQTYFLPVAVMTDPEIVGASGGAISYMIAQVRRGARLEGVYDATAERSFILALLRAITKGDNVACAPQPMTCLPETRLKGLTFADDVEVRRLGADQSNSSLLIGDQVVLKIYRRLVSGTHPEIEFGIFLNQVGFANVPPFLGAMFESDDQTSTGIAIVQGYVRNQGDGWTHASNHLDRILAISPSADETSPEVPDTQSYLTLISTLGRRAAELHRALASPTENADFKAEPISADDLKLWRDEAQATVTQAFARLTDALPRLTPERREEADALLKRKEECERAVGRLLSGPFKESKTRVHGDLHLGQVLIAQTDWYVIDFEGEPTQDLAARRRKYSPMKDIGGMVRSFDRAAQAALQRTAVTEGTAGAGNIARAAEWRDLSINAFLHGYKEVIGGDVDAPESERLLQFYTLEMACCELAHEAVHRPDWIWSPVRGIAAVLDQLAL